MIVVLKQNSDERQLEELRNWLKKKNIMIQESTGESCSIWGLVGDTSELDGDVIASMDVVESVKRIQEPYKKVNRKFHQQDTVISVKNTVIGGDDLTVIAGPCSIESEEQIVAIAKAVKNSGATLLRGGAFKPRTSPYSFQGMGTEGLKLLKIAGKESGLPIVTEIMDVTQLPLFEDVDVIQVGARNMQNFNLLKELGSIHKPILLKRGMQATYEEFLMSAEHIMSGGNEQVILCERGIRTFETYTRNTLDLTAIPALKKLSHLPVIADPSHGTGKADLVPSMAMAAVAAGADGVMIEVHNDPEHAWSDGSQSIRTETFDTLNRKMIALHSLVRE